MNISILYNALFVSLLVIAPQMMYSQTWLQQYPEWNNYIINDILHWNGDTIYAAANHWVLLESADGGKTWNNVLTENKPLDLVSLDRRENILYFNARPLPVNYDGRYRKVDSLNSLFSFTPTSRHVEDISRPLIQPHHLTEPNFLAVTARYLYLTEQQYDGSYLYRSEDNGQSWEQFPCPRTIRGLYALNDTTLIMIANNLSNNIHLYRSTDAGTTWLRDSVNTSVYDPGVRNPIVGNSTSFLVAGLGPEVLISDDGGDSWNKTDPIPWNSLFTSYIRDIVFDTQEHIIVLGVESDVYETWDGGTSWTQIKSPSGYKYSSNCIAGYENLLIVANRDATLDYTDNGGITWLGFNYADMREIIMMHFLNPSDGFVYAWDYDGNTSIYQTTDGGDQWEKQGQFNAFGGRGFVSFPKAEEIVAYNVDGTVTPSTFTLEYSTDGGSHWLAIHTSEFDPENRYVPLHLHASDELFVFTPTTSGKQGFFVSSDRGKNWRYSPGPDPMLQPRDFSVTRRPSGVLVCYYRSSAFARPDPVIYKSIDTCKTWSIVYTPSDKRIGLIRELDVINADTLIILEQGGGGFTLLQYRMSPDGGSTWKTFHTYYLEGTSWHPNKMHYYFLPDIYTIHGSIYITKTTDYWKNDGKQIWNHLYENDPVPFFLDRNHAWIASGQTIYRTTNGGSTWTQMPFTIRENAAITSIYPNPVVAGQSTTIEINVGTQRALSLPHAMSVRVFDLLGREVAVLYNGPADPGTRTLTWQPAPALPAGMYMVRMTLGDRIWAKQVAVVR